MASTQQSNHHHAKPLGQLEGAGIVIGALALLLSVGMEWMGIFNSVNAAVFGLLENPIFHNASPRLLSMPVIVIITAVFSLGIAFAVLDSPGMWRRVVLGLTAIILVIALVPSLAVWDIFYPPLLTLVAVFWAWFCSLMYANHHRMPCDLAEVSLQISPAEPELLKPTEEPPKQPVVIERSHPDYQNLLEKDADEKYKPKPATSAKKKTRKKTNKKRREK